MSDDKALKRAVQYVLLAKSVQCATNAGNRTMRFDASAFEAEPFLLRWGTAGLVSVLQRLSSFGNLRRLVFHFPDLHLVKAEGILKGLQRDLFPVVKSLETSPEGVFVNRLCPHLSRHSIFYCTGWSQRNCERDPEGPKDQFKSAFRELMNRVRYAKGITHLEMDMESNWHHPGSLDQITQSFPNLTELVLYAQRMPFHPASTLPMLSRMTELRVLHLPHMDELWYDRDGTIDQRLYDGEPAHYWDLCRMALRMFSAVPTLQRIGSGRFWDRYYLMDVVYGEHGGMLGIDTSDLRPGEETLNLWRDFDLVDLWQNGTTTNKKHRAVAEIRVFASAT